jgi:hypothetical protein
MTRALVPAPLSETASRILVVLERVVAAGETVTYAELAREAEVLPPHSIHQTAEALEEIIRHDFAAGLPLRAAVVISAKRGGIPAPGFFQLATEIGLYFGPDSGPQAATFHALELERLRR